MNKLKFLIIWCLQIIMNGLCYFMLLYTSIIPNNAIAPIMSLLNIFYCLAHTPMSKDKRP